MKRTGALSVLAALAIAGMALADTPSPGVATPDRNSPHAPAGASFAERARGIAASAVGETMTTAKIKAAIAGDSGMKDSDISVSTQNGVVTLSGTVKSQEQITIATNLAQRQEGVSRVESKLAIK